MSLAELITNIRLFSVRFLLVSVLPTLALLATVLLLALSGAPHHHPDLSSAIKRLEHLSGSQIVWIVLAAITLSVLLYPLQFSMIQLLEGYWGTSWPLLQAARLASRRYDRKRRKWDQGRQGIGHHKLSDSEVVRITNIYGGAIASLPHPERIMPTRLGNVLRAAEDLAGERYGLSTALMTPRLIPQLSAKVADRLADSRLQLDIAVRFCIVWLLATLADAAMLIHAGVWLWVPAATYALAWLSYRAACAAAQGYGTMLAVAFDLYRFDLLKALHQPLPRGFRDEISRNRILMQIIAGDLTDSGPQLSNLPRIGYRHPPQVPAGSADGQAAAADAGTPQQPGSTA